MSCTDSGLCGGSEVENTARLELGAVAFLVVGRGLAVAFAKSPLEFGGLFLHRLLGEAQGTVQCGQHKQHTATQVRDIQGTGVRAAQTAHSDAGKRYQMTIEHKGARKMSTTHALLHWKLSNV